jgi:hypothetical protein
MYGFSIMQGRTRTALMCDLTDRVGFKVENVAREGFKKMEQVSHDEMSDHFLRNC